MAFSPEKINVFVTGPTGYIGGTVLAKLLEHKDIAHFSITALLRSSEKARTLRERNVQPLIGSNEDLNKLEVAAANSDVVISIADADNLPAIQAILRGSKARFLNTGKKPIIIHTSGTAVVVEHAGGNYAGGTVYNDADTSQMAGIDISNLHRNVDIELVDADKEGYVNTYIILPGIIYGLATHTLTDVNFSNRHSILIPIYIRIALHRGEAGYVGQGKNIWPHVHIDDVANLYMQILDKAIEQKIGHGTDGYYFGENGESTMESFIQVIGQELSALGKISSPNASSLTEEEITRYFGAAGLFFGTNSRVIADHSRSTGWSPKYTSEDLNASIKPEIELILQSPPRDPPYISL